MTNKREKERTELHKTIWQTAVQSSIDTFKYF